MILIKDNRFSYFKPSFLNGNYLGWTCEQYCTGCFVAKKQTDHLGDIAVKSKCFAVVDGILN